MSNVYANGKVCYPRAVSRLDVASPSSSADEASLRRIQEVAAETGLTPRAIRYYEELGLLEPAARSEGAYRLYDAEDLERLRFIHGLRDDAGFSLAEIGQLLEDERVRARNKPTLQTSTDPAERRAILIDAIERIDRQMGSLRLKVDRLTAMIDDASRRRDHLREHVADIDAGRPHVHTTGAPDRTRRSPSRGPAR
jgi:DNA-binding transcriptional MerR regulator